MDREKQKKWLHRAHDYLRMEGLRKVTLEQYRARVPRSIAGSYPRIVQDFRQPFGFRSPGPRAVKAYYNKLAPYYDTQLMTAYEIEVKALAFVGDFMDRSKPKRVIDAGCGTGLTTVFLAKHFPDVHVLGYDIAGNMVRRARARCRKANLLNVEIVRMEHGDLPQGVSLTTADLLIAKCSLGLDPVLIPDFLDKSLPSFGRSDFYRDDATMRRWQESLDVFSKLLAPDGMFLDIGIACSERDRCISDFARFAGFEKDDAYQTVIDVSEDDEGKMTVVSSGYRKKI